MFGIIIKIDSEENITFIAYQDNDMIIFYLFKECLQFVIFWVYNYQN